MRSTTSPVRGGTAAVLAVLAALMLCAVRAPLVADGAPAQPPRAAPAIDLARVELVDLTHPFDARAPYWPTAPSGFRLDTLAYGRTPGGYFYSAFGFAAPEHGGTHLDAPIHFAEGARTADAIPLAQLVAPAVV